MLTTNSSTGLEEFIEYLQNNGRLYQTDAIDYFVFNRGIEIEWTKELPPYIVGGVVFGQSYFILLLMTALDKIILIEL